MGLDEGPVSGFDGPGSELRAAVFADGGELSIRALLVRTTLHQRSSLASALGASLTEPDEMLSVEAIKVDAMPGPVSPDCMRPGMRRLRPRRPWRPPRHRVTWPAPPLLCNWPAAGY
ncbi:hypothetical protein ACGFWE_42070 [Streptomyces sp. NPDC048523]|uniref:hypothetical protein n=1 Tax=Streptomyces sp. NPDC048523 TaxID=3365567 RepID=UPI003714488D